MTVGRGRSGWSSVGFGWGAGVGDHDNYLEQLFRDPLDPGYRDAAARRRAREWSGGSGGSGQGPDGAGGGSWRRRGGRAAAIVALLVVGLLFAVAYRQVVAEEPTRTQVRADLEAQIRERGDTADQLQERVEALRDEVAELRDRELTDPQARQLRELEAATGLTRVRGDGVVVTVDHGPAQVDPVTGEEEVDPEARILDVDLQRITNGLWAAGAEAIAINGRRLTSNSTIRNASGAILVDRVPVVGPYEVTAIGPDELPERFAGSVTGGQMQQLVQEFGIAYEVRSAGDLTLPATTAPPLYHATLPGGD